MAGDADIAEMAGEPGADGRGDDPQRRRRGQMTARPTAVPAPGPMRWWEVRGRGVGPYALTFAVAAVAYYAAGRLGLWLRTPDAAFALFWPAAGVSSGLLMVAVRRPALVPVPAVVVGVAVASMAANLRSGSGVALALGFTAGNLAEPATAALVVHLRPRNPHPAAFLVTLGLSAALGTIVGAAVAVAAVTPQLDLAPWDLALSWIVPDAAGIATVAPLVLLAHDRLARRFWGGPPVGVPRHRRPEAAAHALAATSLVWVAFGGEAHLPLAFLPAPAIVWAASRLGPRWTVATIATMSVAVVALSGADRGPFVFETPTTIELLVSQLYLITNVVIGLTLAVSVAERALASDAAATSRQLYESVFSTRDDGLLVFDARGEVLAANEGVRRLLQLDGVPTDLDSPLGDHEVVELDGAATPSPAGDRPTLRSLVRTDAPDGGVVGIRRSGSYGVPRWIRTTVTELVRTDGDAGGRSAEMWARVVTLRDVTDEVEVDRAKREFVSVVSHELRTPLTAIGGAVGLLRGGVAGELSAHQRQLVALAARNVGRLAGLVENMLDFQRLDRAAALLERVPVAAAELVHPAVDDIRDDARAAEVEVVIGRCEGTVWADPAGIGQVLGHLLANAVKFSSPGTTTTIEAVRGSGGDVVFSVTDEGKGIAEDHLERIFESFEQADASDSRDVGGVGLGLAICRAIVRGHQGSITATSRLGEGSMFSVTLPGVHDRPVEATSDEVDAVRAARHEVDEPLRP